MILLMVVSLSERTVLDQNNTGSLWTAVKTSVHHLAQQDKFLSTTHFIPLSQKSILFPKPF
jgi:hypothetical protein